VCDSIRFSNGISVLSVKEFQDTFKVDARKYGWDGNLIDSCMCGIDIDKFFKEHPEHDFYYDYGEWWEKSE